MSGLRAGRRREILSTMRSLPSGEVTLLFTDIDGSTRLLHELGDAYADVLAEHRRHLREAFQRHKGVEVDTQGDALFVAFAQPGDALAAAADAQRSLAKGPVRVRMGLHTGRPVRTDEGYVGMDVHLGARIAAAGHGGQVVVSRTTVGALGGAESMSDLGEHRLKDIAEPVWLYQLRAPGLGADFPPLRTISNTNLPAPARRLVGRERELAEICGRIRSGEARLVTVTGAGGTGKTRLAVQAGLDLVEHFPNGVFFVGLAPLEDAGLVIPTIAQTLGVRESPGEPALELLAAHLGMRRILLVLDNLEHLIAAAADIAELVVGAHGVSVIATSREPLRVAAEEEHPLAPLDQDHAVELFSDRARAVDPRFTADAATEEVCRKLDGLPLAIELAAARVRLLPPRSMLARIEPRLSVLTGGGRDVPARQRTLRAAIDWSHDLLDAEEQRLFRSLSVFAGGCDLDAAERVCAADAAVLESLVQKSLVLQRPDAAGLARFLMLATIREYAGERLAASGERADLEGRHAAHMLELAESAEPQLLGRAQVEWLGRLEQEIDNIRAAVSAALAAGEPEVALGIASALIDFWDTRGSYAEVREWLRDGLARAAACPARVRAKAALAAGLAAVHLGDPEEARELTRTSLDLAREAGDARVTSRALSQLAGIAMLEGDFQQTVELAEAGSDAAVEAGDDAIRAYALNMLAIGKHELGDIAEAEALFEQTAALLRAAGDLRDLAILQGNLGNVALLAGDCARARGHFESALALSEELGSRGRLPSHHQDMGIAALLDGSLDEAAAHLSTALVDGRQVGDTPTVMSALQTVAGLMAARGDERPAGMLRGAAGEAMRAQGLTLSGADVLVDQRFLEPLSGADLYAAGLAAGNALTLDAAVDAALEGLRSPAGSAVP
jgi:predicted ATPase/class 3 adenylate cyclase